MYFTSLSRITRDIFNSWSKRKQNAYLKEHPTSMFHPKKKIKVTKSETKRSGRPRQSFKEKVSGANNEFNKAKSPSAKKAVVEKALKSVHSTLNRRIDTSKMTDAQRSAAIKNMADKLIKHHAPGIHRSRIYKDMMDKGVVSRPRGPGMSGLAQKEQEIKQAQAKKPQMKSFPGATYTIKQAPKAASIPVSGPKQDFKPKAQLNEKSKGLLKEALKTYNAIQQPEAKKTLGSRIYNGIKNTLKGLVPHNELEDHIKHELKQAGVKNFTQQRNMYY